MKTIPCLIPLLLAAHSAWALNPHPRIWLSSQMLTDMAAKVAANDADWVAVKSQANTFVSWSIPTMTITGASNSNPVQFTVTETVPMSSGAILFIGGGTGKWAGVNFLTGLGWSATVTGTHTFTIPVDSTSFGSFSGQSLATFLKSGCLSNTICYDYESMGWLATVPSLAIAYKLTGTTAYATTALAWLDYVNAASAVGIYAPASVDVGYPSRGAALSVALVYDWCYGQLSGGQKTATAVTADLWYTWMSKSAFGTTGLLTGGGTGGMGPNSNYTGGHILGYGTLGYAIYGDDSNAQTMIDWASTKWNALMPLGFAAPVVGDSAYTVDARGVYNAGTNAEWHYGSGHIPRLLEYALAVQTATGSKASNIDTYMPLWANAFLYDLMPNRWEVRNDGSWSGNVAGVPGGGMALHLSYMLSGTTAGAWMQWAFTHFGTPDPLDSEAPGMLSDASDGLGYIPRLLFYRAAAPSTDYRLTQPTSFYGASCEPNVYWRSDWTDSATWMVFHPSTEYCTGSHWAGGVIVTHGADKLIVNSQYWFGTGVGDYGTPGIAQMPSHMVSTLYFDDGGAYFPSGSNYYGGQGLWGYYVEPLRKVTDAYTYASNNLAEAYDYQHIPASRSLRYFYRSVVAIGDGTFVVWDQVKALSSAYTKSIRWHLSSIATTPSTVGSVVSATVTNSKVFIDSVLPASPTIAVTRNKSGDGITGASDVTWKVDVKDSVTGTDLNALTVLYATSSSGSLPTTAAITTDANHVGVQVADTTPKVAVFAAPVTFTSLGTYTPNTYTSTTFTSTHSGIGKYLIAGLAPGTYSVLRGGAAIPGYSSAPVGTDGTLFFSAAAGAFSILPSSTSTNPCDLNGDGVVNILDVQVAVNQALGSIPCGSADLDGNGACTLLDVQRVVNAANGQACKVGQ